MYFVPFIFVGLAGLAMMAIPGLNRHGRAGVGHAGVAHGHGSAAMTSLKSAGSAHKTGAIWHIPSPRPIFSLLALYGGFGYCLVEAGHVPPHSAMLIAIVPALLVEIFLVTPLWNLMFRFQGTPSSPFSDLILNEAKAVTPFRNQKGIVSVTHNGRLVQFRAELTEADKAAQVKVGDKLIIEDVDSDHERVTVAVVSAQDDLTNN